MVRVHQVSISFLVVMIAQLSCFIKNPCYHQTVYLYAMSMKAFRIFILVCLVLLSMGKGEAGSCLFCRPEIIDNETVFQSEHFVILPDREPRVKGHLLVVPKRHIEKAHELTKEEWAGFSFRIPKVVKVFSEYFHTDQYIILEKNGPSAFQQIPHVHFHLFPVSSQTWSEIFDITPERMSQDEFEEELARFRGYFSMNYIPFLRSCHGKNQS
jgi:histidine triad (HIT) family protein